MLLHTGPRTFARKDYKAGEEYATAVSSGDINGDGRADLAVVLDDKVSVLLGRADGTFGSATRSAPSAKSSS